MHIVYASKPQDPPLPPNLQPNPNLNHRYPGNFRFIYYFRFDPSYATKNLLQILVLAGLGLGAGVAVGSVGAAIGLASARQEVKNCKVVFLFFYLITIIIDQNLMNLMNMLNLKYKVDCCQQYLIFQVGLLFRLFNQGTSGGLTLADAIVGDDVLRNI